MNELNIFYYNYSHGSTLICSVIVSLIKVSLAIYGMSWILDKFINVVNAKTESSSEPLTITTCTLIGSMEIDTYECN